MKIHTIKYQCFRILALALFMLPAFQRISHAQADSLSDITGKCKHFNTHDLQEKLFVHTDKDFYLAGEIIWFKIYDINEATNAPFDFSKVAYVELLGNNHTPVLQTKIALGKNGNGGSLFLPFTLHSGNYVFRAYTSWMKNFSPDYYFEKTITIINTTKDNAFPQESDSIHDEITFFPEGGYLVNGLQSEVGFHVVNQYGKGADFTGVVVNQQNDTLLHFQPYRFGMGHFYFTPDTNKQYKAIIRIKDGPILSAYLPEIKTTGMVMHLQGTQDNQVQITIRTNRDNEKFCYLIIHTRDSVKAAEVLFFKDGEAAFTINKNRLGEGISQFTVFNSLQQPICERLYFKQPYKKLIIHAETNQQSYAMRHKVLLNFQTTNENHKPESDDISISVYRCDSLQTIDQGNILSYIWLNSDLKGHIQSPEYYFQNHNDSVTQALDNLMLTQGWRRFEWRKVMQNKLPLIQFMPELSGPIISGKAVNSQTGLPAPNVLTYLSIPGKGAKVQGYLTNAEGRFYFNMENFYGPHKIVVEADTQTKDSVDQIEVFNPFSDKYSNNPISKFSISPSLADELYDHNLWTQAQHAYHPIAFNRFVKSHTDTLSFFGKPSKTYWLDDYTRYPTMEEVMKEYVQEVAVRVKDKHYRFMVVNNYDKSVYSSLFSDDPLVILDGVPVFNIDKVIAIDPLKVQKLDVLTGRYFYGPIIADGILSYSTYKGNMDNFSLNPQAIKINYSGLQQEREFYSPEYATEKDQSTSIPDFRNVLYWSPEIKTNPEGKAQCSFYTSDIRGKYVVIVNGISKDGYAGYASFMFEVEK